jgi:hypothetical protein
MGANYKTHKKRKHGSIKCNHIKVIYVNQDNSGTSNSEIIEDKSDFTLIILKEQTKYYNHNTSNNNSKTSEIPPIIK